MNTALFAMFVTDASASGLSTIQLIIAYGLLLLLFLFGAIILVLIATGVIDLRLLLSESGGGASMSRFQLLIFTFVISFSFFLLVTSSKQFPVVPSGVLTLLGISATTYGVSKGIQASTGSLSKTAGEPKTPPQ